MFLNNIVIIKKGVGSMQEKNRLCGKKDCIANIGWKCNGSRKRRRGCKPMRFIGGEKWQK